MIFADYGKFKMLLKKNGSVEVRVKNKKDINNELKEQINTIAKSYPELRFSVVYDNKYYVEGMAINNLEKLSLHVGQKLKLLVKVVAVEERKTKNGKYMYTLTLEIPGKNKYLKGVMFTISVLTIKKDSFYIVDGFLKKGEDKYIQQNEKILGKEVDYNLMISGYEEYSKIESVEENKYSIPRQELHFHTSYSKNDAFITPEALKKAFIENKVDTVALTDHGTVMSFLPFVNDLKREFKDKGKKIILGVEFYSTDYDEHQSYVYEKIEDFESKIAFKESDGYKEYKENMSEMLEIENSISTLTESKLDLKNKTIELRDMFKSKDEERKKEEDKNEREEIIAEQKQIKLEITELTGEQKEISTEIAELKSRKIELKKENSLLKKIVDEEEKEQIKITMQLEGLKSELGCVHNSERDHITVLLKSKDTEVMYKGEKLTINQGLVELYKLITKSYSDYFSVPTELKKKMYGARPMLPYHELEKVREHFIVTSACAFGRHMKLAIAEKWDEFRLWIKKLDAVEIQPLHNNIYMVEHQDYPLINSVADVLALHRKIYTICKEENVPIIFTSDAHVIDKEDRYKRRFFKSGYITNIINQKEASDENRRKKEAEAKGEIYVERGRQVNGDDDFSEDTQPYVLSFDEMISELSSQGFNEEEIKEIVENTKRIADECANAFEITLLPKKMFLPEFPGLDVKEEIPRLVWDFSIRKWSKDGTKEGIDSKIKKRIDEELDAIKKTGYEILYYVTALSCQHSRDLGYDVSSRGSAGSMVTTLALKIGENNPLEPHYYCPDCKNIEWLGGDLVGLDYPDKQCPNCEGIMAGDGCDIDSHNFLGWGKHF